MSEPGRLPLPQEEYSGSLNCSLYDLSRMIFYLSLLDLDNFASLCVKMSLGHGVPPPICFFAKLIYRIRGHHDLIVRNILRYVLWKMSSFGYDLEICHNLIGLVEEGVLYVQDGNH